jgi:hypothetical protein
LKKYFGFFFFFFLFLNFGQQPYSFMHICR